MSEWFSGRLRHVGHYPLDAFTRGRAYTTIERQLERLRKYDLDHVVTVHIWEANQHSDEMMTRIAEQCEFDHWTSFRYDDSVYFVFRSYEDAIQFKLMWP